jgi:hypothetical protein
MTLSPVEFTQASLQLLSHDDHIGAKQSMPFLHCASRETMFSMQALHGGAGAKLYGPA